MIDLSSTIYDALKRAVQEYTSLKDNGDFDGARRKAAEIAKLYRNLAEMNPVSQTEDLNRAKRWQDIASGLKPISAKNAIIKDSVSESESETKNDDSASLQSTVDALLTTSQVKWSDIAGLDSAKHLLMETTVIPAMKKSESIKPWKGILLFGPPGTGKTLLSSAAAGSLHASFYNVKAGSILSKYFGESSKIISQLYKSAREHSPSIVFIDEMDAITQSREGEVSEASRKVLSTLLTELDGLTEKKSNKLVLTLSATNTPWDLDAAALSRFTRRIYVPLPDAVTCASIIKLQTRDLDISNVNVKKFAELSCSRFFSGRDIEAFCQEAILRMIRDVNPGLYKYAELPYETVQGMSLKTRPLTDTDFEKAANKIKSTVTKTQIERYEEWSQKYGERINDDE